MSRKILFFILALFLIPLVLLLMTLLKPQASKITQTTTDEKTTTETTSLSSTPSSMAEITPTKIIEIISKESFAQTVLSFGDSSVIDSTASTINYSMPVNISTGKNKVTAVQLELQYDPKILTNMAITSGPFFTKSDVLLNKIDTENGRISYAIIIGLTDEGVVGDGVVVNLTFSTSALVPAKTKITFLSKTKVTAEGISESVLKQTVTSPFVCGCAEN